MEVRYKLNNGQLTFLQSRNREAAIVSGLGGGKSFALRLSLLVDALRFPGALHCYASLSYQNMKDSAIPKFKELLNECGIHFKEMKQAHEILVGPRETRCLFRTQESYNNLRSVEFGSLKVDEMAYWSEDAYLTFLGRLRDPKGPLTMRAATTPNSLNFFYNLFVKSLQEGNILETERILIRTSTLDNRHLPESYLKILEGSYDKHRLQQERDGMFLAKGGRTYYSFNQDVNVKRCEYDPKLPVVVGMDFNVKPMTAVCVQHHGDKTIVFKEFWLEDSNTESMGKAIIAHFGGANGITIIPDSTGNNRKTSSTKTDFAILMEMGFHIPKVRNPQRKDRFNNINRRLDKGLLEIEPSCKHLIEDLNFFVEESASSTPMLGHISDALGYPEWFYFPIIIKTSRTSTITQL